MEKFALITLTGTLFFAFAFFVIKQAKKDKMKKEDPLFSLVFSFLIPFIFFGLIVYLMSSLLPMTYPNLCYPTKEYKEWKINNEKEKEKAVKKAENVAKKDKVKELVGFSTTEDTLSFWERRRSSDRDFDNSYRLEKSVNGAFGNKYRFLFNELKEYETNPYKNGTYSISYSDGGRRSLLIKNDFVDESGNTIWKEITIYEKDKYDRNYIYLIQSDAHLTVFDKEAKKVQKFRNLTDDEIVSLLRQCSVPKEILDKVAMVQKNTKISHENVMIYDSLLVSLNKELKLYTYASEEYIRTFLKIKDAWNKYSIAQEYYKKLSYY